MVKKIPGNDADKEKEVEVDNSGAAANRFRVSNKIIVRKCTRAAKKNAASSSKAASAAPIINNCSDDETCPECHIPYTSVNGLLYKICVRCGKRKETIDPNTMVPFFKEGDSSFHYKRINRLNEFMNLMQGKENLTNTNEIASYVEMIMEHLYCDKGIDSIDDITLDVVHAAMKAVYNKTKMKSLKKYYENYVRFHHMITNITPPQFSNAQEERIRARFRFIQPFFKKHKPKHRKNFYSYSYFVYQVCVIEKWFEFLPYLRLHKGTDKRVNLDKIWKNICVDANDKDLSMRWPFFKTPFVVSASATANDTE